MHGTRKLGRKTDHRMAMLKGMATYLLEYGKIETTVTRAKEVSALTDKMVTLGKANTLASRRQAMSFLKKESVVTKLFTEIAPLYADRAEMAVIMMVDASAVYDKKPAQDEKSAKKAKDAKKADAADKTEKKKPAARKKAEPKAETAEPAAAEA